MKLWNVRSIEEGRRQKNEGRRMEAEEWRELVRDSNLSAIKNLLIKDIDAVLIPKNLKEINSNLMSPHALKILPSRKKLNNSGFTLIEMLTVAAIVSVIAAVAVPNLLGLIYKARVTDGVADVEAAIKEAKRLAVRYSQSCVIQLGTTTIDGETRVVVEAPTTGFPANNSRCLFERRVLPTEVTVTDDIPSTINFSSKGNIGNTNEYNPANTGNWTITVSHDNVSTSKCVRVEGLFGDVQTGIVQGGVCNTNL
jgi:prepilin-type N-terminal cleavage/methylation domain-containing protein